MTPRLRSCVVSGYTIGPLWSAGRNWNAMAHICEGPLAIVVGSRRFGGGRYPVGAARFAGVLREAETWAAAETARRNELFEAEEALA